MKREPTLYTEEVCRVGFFVDNSNMYKFFWSFPNRWDIEWRREIYYNVKYSQTNKKFSELHTKDRKYIFYGRSIS